MHNYTYYNPITNDLKKAGYYNKLEGYFCCGCRKFAEAMSTVNKEDRLTIWNSKIGNTQLIDINSLSSKLRHKLSKIGINQSFDWLKDKSSNGAILLRKINKK